MQLINTDNICRKSDWVAILKCVPHGSMLVPVMFILYVADDTSVMVQSYKEDDHKMKIRNMFLGLTNLLH